MTEFRRNAFKAAIRAKKLQVGLWQSLCSNVAVEICSDSGFDWLLLDTEHSPNEIPDLLSQLQAMEKGTATAIIRPAWNDAVLIKRCLDIGAQALLIPYVQSVEEAKAAVAATRYPPHGIRGVSVSARASRYGRVSGYLTKANSEICVLVQVETRQSLDALEDIAAVVQGCAKLTSNALRKCAVGIRTIRYEELVADSASRMRELAAWIGLGDFAVPAAPSAATISTSSLWQVRQPVYARSIGRWRAYAPHVPELMRFPDSA